MGSRHHIFCRRANEAAPLSEPSLLEGLFAVYALKKRSVHQRASGVVCRFSGGPFSRTPQLKIASSVHRLNSGPAAMRPCRVDQLIVLAKHVLDCALQFSSKNPAPAPFKGACRVLQRLKRSNCHSVSQSLRPHKAIRRHKGQQS